MVRTENRNDTKTKFKRIFKVSLPDKVITNVHNEHLMDIMELKKAFREDLHAHELSDPRVRLDRYQALAKQCEEGYYTGAVDATGMPIQKFDPKTALECYKACRDEQHTHTQNELKLLQIAIFREKLSGGIHTPPITDEGGSQITVREDVKLIAPSDNDKFFEE